MCPHNRCGERPRASSARVRSGAAWCYAMTRRSRAFQESEEPPNNLIRPLENTRSHRSAQRGGPRVPGMRVSGMILNRTGRWMKGFTVNFQDAPLAVAADEEVGLAILSGRGLAKPASTVRKEEHTGAVKGLGDPNLALGTKVEILPDSQGSPLRSLVVHTDTAGDLEELVPPIRVDRNVLGADGEVLDVGLIGQHRLKGASDRPGGWMARIVQDLVGCAGAGEGYVKCLVGFITNVPGVTGTPELQRARQKHAGSVLLTPVYQEA